MAGGYVGAVLVFNVKVRQTCLMRIRVVPWGLLVWRACSYVTVRVVRGSWRVWERNSLVWSGIVCIVAFVPETQGLLRAICEHSLVLFLVFMWPEILSCRYFYERIYVYLLPSRILNVYVSTRAGLCKCFIRCMLCLCSYTGSYLFELESVWIMCFMAWLSLAQQTELCTGYIMCIH